MIIGSGGVLSHAPRRTEAAYMMLDAYQPEGITMLAVDSIFMMPQLGVLSTVLPEAASQVFEKDCLVKMGHVVAPVGKGKIGDIACEVTINNETHSVAYGDLKLVQLGPGEIAEALIKPSGKFDCGNGRGKQFTTKLEGGTVGLIIDCRGRPMNNAQNSERIDQLAKWHAALGLEVI